MSLLKSITTFGGWTLISRITGFFRDVVLANYLGAGLVSDAFFVAFKLPNLFRSLFAEGAFTAAFVPIFSQKLVDDGKAGAVKFAARAISVLVVFVGLFVLLMELVMPAVVMLLAPGFASDAGKIELAVFLSRITFPFLLLVSVVSFQSGILNSLGKFAAPAAAPVILNLTMVASVFVLMPFIATPAYRITLGVPAAGVLEVLWLHYFLKRQDVFIRPQRRVFALAASDEIKTLFKRIAPTQDKAIEYGALMSVPAAVFMIVLAEPMVNILFQHGKFGAFQTQMTAQAVIVYAIGIPVYVMVKAMTPNFFARCDTKTPVKYSAVVLAANLLFALALMQPFGHVGIAAATTLAAFVSFYQYARGLSRYGYWRFSPELVRRIAKIVACSLLTGLFLFAETKGLNLLSGNWLELSTAVKLLLLAVICSAAGMLFLVLVKLCGIADVFAVAKAVLKRRKP